jgi:hypothetical protein
VCSEATGIQDIPEGDDAQQFKQLLSALARNAGESTAAASLDSRSVSGPNGTAPADVPEARLLCRILGLDTILLAETAPFSEEMVLL